MTSLTNQRRPPSRSCWIFARAAWLTRPAFTFLQRNGSKIMTWSYRELLDHANAVGAAIAAAGVRPGDRVVIGCSYPSEFVPAFFGTIRAGAIPVPTPAPTSHQARRFIGIVADCQPAAAFVTSDEGKAGCSSAPRSTAEGRFGR